MPPEAAMNIEAEKTITLKEARRLSRAAWRKAKEALAAMDEYLEAVEDTRLECDNDVSNVAWIAGHLRSCEDYFPQR